MTAALTSSMAALIGFCIVTESARELCFKKAAHGETIKNTLLKPLMLAGITIWAVELVAWIRVLEKVPLNVAFPLMALVYVVTVLGGAILLGEEVGWRHGLGAALVTAGVAWIGATG